MVWAIEGCSVIPGLVEPAKSALRVNVPTVSNVTWSSYLIESPMSLVVVDPRGVPLYEIEMVSPESEAPVSDLFSTPSIMKGCPCGVVEGAFMVRFVAESREVTVMVLVAWLVR